VGKIAILIFNRKLNPLISRNRNPQQLGSFSRKIENGKNCNK
jgi:hypothetical protein